mmetsp:Transcript_85585/g.276196  ORF Transcript_85585/g.276196 Transcript_85585/m.276196 type:complete len:213 (-) Transcript_85585:600-1238(-)
MKDTSSEAGSETVLDSPSADCCPFGPSSKRLRVDGGPSPALLEAGSASGAERPSFKSCSSVLQSCLKSSCSRSNEAALLRAASSARVRIMRTLPRFPPRAKVRTCRAMPRLLRTLPSALGKQNQACVQNSEKYRSATLLRKRFESSRPGKSTRMASRGMHGKCPMIRTFEVRRDWTTSADSARWTRLRSHSRTSPALAKLMIGEGPRPPNRL